jgi:hypothetical protein
MINKENQMNKNVGTIDRSIRAILGIGIIGAGIAFGSWWGAVGLVLLGTAAIGWCPPYAMFGISTCKVQQGSEN